MRADLERVLCLDPDSDRDLRLPLSPGLNELMRRRVFLSRPRDSSDAYEALDTERLVRLREALASPLRFEGPSRRRRRSGDRDGERLVDMVETESKDEVDRDRERFRSCSFFLRISSATPFLRWRSSGTSVVSLGFSFGLSSC